MKDVLAITSYSARYWNETARHCVPTWLGRWPGPIAAYVEGDADAPAGIEERPLIGCEGLSNALDRYERIPFLTGQLPRNSGYSYNFDLMRFCKKVYAICDAATRHDGYLFWIDADVEFTAEMPLSECWDLMQGVMVAYAGRDPRAIAHSENCFVGFDTTHVEAAPFFAAWRDLYDHGSVLALPGFHDCFTMDTLLGNPRVPKRSYTAGLPGVDVIPRSRLARFLIHHKGEQGKARLSASRP